LKTLSFKIGSPTVKEFIDRYLEEISDQHTIISQEDKKLHQTCMFLSKLACHDYKLMQTPNSILAASVINVALKICCKSDPMREEIK